MIKPILMLACWVFVGGITSCTNDSLDLSTSKFLTHGPILGKLGSDRIGVWVRTAAPDTFLVRYGIQPDFLNYISSAAVTTLARDNCGQMVLTGLEPDTRYYYQVVPSPEVQPDLPVGSFTTLPKTSLLRDPELNPKGLFNFSFEFGCGNYQTPGSESFDLPIYRTMLDRIGSQVNFAILNGDWLYEEKRDFSITDWKVANSENTVPEILKKAPLIAGVWENYKLYLDRHAALRKWHSQVPSFFTFDDHELLDDIRGSGLIGYQDRRAVYRDIGVRGFYDYIGWSNPTEFNQRTHFGLGEVTAERDLLVDTIADFSKLDFNQISNLHIHWQGPDGWQKPKIYDIDPVDGSSPNAGVYEIIEVVDKHRLRIHPTPAKDGMVPYSLGRLSYFSKRIANCEFIFLDTRSHRELPVQAPGASTAPTLLGAQQKEWVKSVMRKSDADFFFVISSVNLVIPHLLDMGEEGPEKWTGQHDSWTGFPGELDEMLNFWDSLGKSVFVLTGDIHNSFAAQVRPNIWEFASGPHSSRNAHMASEGGRPANGKFTYQDRNIDIRWSTYKRMDAVAYQQPVYCVVQVNNVFNNPKQPGTTRWVAYPMPQVTFSYYDGNTGGLLYSESIVK